MLTAWCEAQVSCDQSACVAPLIERDGSHAQTEPTVERTKRTAVAKALRMAKAAGWKLIGDKWLCPWCAAEQKG